MMIVITGGTGKTGREVVKALSSRGDARLRIASRHPAPNPGPGASVKFDWEMEATWTGAVEQANAIYLVKPKTADPAATVAAFLDQCRHVERIVLLSEIAAEKQDVSADELRVEKVVEGWPGKWTVLRPNWFMQNFATPSFFGDAIRLQHSVTVPTGGQAVSFVDTRDIAAVAVAALLEPGHEHRHYTVTGPEALTLPEALKRIAAVSGYEILHVDPPLDQYLKNAEAGGVGRNAIDYYHRIYTNISNGSDSIVTGDVKEVTGRPPRNFADFVNEHRHLWSS